MIQRQSFLMSYPLSLNSLARSVEKLGMARRIVRAEVVDRMHEASPQEMRPHPIDERLGQRFVVGVGDELAELGATDHIGPLTDLSPIQEPREGDADQSVAAVESDIRVGRLITQLGVIIGIEAGRVGLGDVLRLSCP